MEPSWHGILTRDADERDYRHGMLVSGCGVFAFYARLTPNAIAMGDVSPCAVRCNSLSLFALFLEKGNPFNGVHQP
jgi:hypothetical protein